MSNAHAYLVCGFMPLHFNVSLVLCRLSLCAFLQLLNSHSLHNATNNCSWVSQNYMSYTMLRVCDAYYEWLQRMNEVDIWPTGPTHRFPSLPVLWPVPTHSPPQLQIPGAAHEPLSLTSKLSEFCCQMSAFWSTDCLSTILGLDLLA